MKIFRRHQFIIFFTFCFIASLIGHVSEPHKTKLYTEELQMWIFVLWEGVCESRILRRLQNVGLAVCYYTSQVAKILSVFLYLISLFTASSTRSSAQSGPRVERIPLPAHDTNDFSSAVAASKQHCLAPLLFRKTHLFVSNVKSAFLNIYITHL